MSELRDPEKGYGLIDQMKNAVRLHKSAYDQVFGGHGASQTVLKDLARFCRANKTTFHTNEQAHYVLVGRHEVWLYIQERLNLSSEELFQLSQDRKKQ